tara:strand:- start:388 stop:588 length:201 start_codon:yes stop_codon:yes gene_type:complete
MANLLDHVPRTPVLERVNTWPKSATREHWARLTKALVAGVIADMDDYLDEQEVAQVEQAFVDAGLL